MSFLTFFSTTYVQNGETSCRQPDQPTRRS